MDSLKQNLCYAPDQKMFRTKKLQIIKKSNWHHKIFFSLFHVKNGLSPMKAVRNHVKLFHVYISNSGFSKGTVLCGGY